MTLRIDERVVEAHLSHFCPGGASFPVTTSRPVGLDLDQAVPADPALAGAPARAAGQRCDRCQRPIGPGQDVRRRVSGAWVHEHCPGRVRGPGPARGPGPGPA